MHQPEDAPQPRPTPALPAAPSVASGALPRAMPAYPAHDERGAQRPTRTSTALAVPLAQSGAAAAAPAGWRASAAVWWRRAGWIALLTLVVIVPVAQWGASKDDLFAAASAARSAWRYDRALTFYARIAQHDPSDPRPYCLQGQVLALQQLYTQAQTAYFVCERMGDNSPNTWLAQGDAASSAGEMGAAEQAWVRAIAAGSRMARRRLALVYEQAGRFSEAAAQWQALGSADGQAREHLGLLALSAGDYAAAGTAFVAARTLSGVYGQEAVDQGFVALAALAPPTAAGLAAIGGAFVRAGMPALARQPLERAVALDPSYGPAHAYLAWVWLAAGQNAAAGTEAAAAVRLAPGESFGWFVAADVALAAGQWGTAVADLQAGIPSDNHNPVLWAALGSAYLGERDYVHAELSLMQAARFGSEPAFTVRLLEFYVAHSIGVASGTAERAATAALERFPTDAPVALLAGEAYALSGHVDAAYVAYQRANALDPSLPEPYFYLGRVAFAGGDYDLAALELSTYLALRPAGDLAAQARALSRRLAWFDL